jgi:hypothetical protein
MSTSHSCESTAGRRSTALIHRCRPSAPRTRPTTPTVAGALSPTNRAGQLATTWPTPRGSADRLTGDLTSKLLQIIVAEVHV